MKRVIVLCVAVAVMATIIVTGSVAYFTDSVVSRGNILESGELKIVQYEMERGKDINGNDVLKNFSQNKQLLPSVGSSDIKAEVTLDATLTLTQEEPTASKTITGVKFKALTGIQNYVDKIVCVENQGTLEMFARTFVAVPTKYDDADDQEGISWIHLDFNTTDSGWVVDKVIENQVITVDDKTATYDIYVATLTTPLASGAISSPSLVGFYMDSAVTNEDGMFVYVDSTGKKTELWPTSDKNGQNNTIQILVQSEAAQVLPFTTPTPDPSITPTATLDPSTAYTAFRTTYEKDVTGDYHPWRTDLPTANTSSEPTTTESNI